MSGMSVIKDGASGNTAQVDSNNRLSTAAVTKSEAVASSLIGDTYFISTGTVNLTDDGMSQILYIENNESVNWIVDSLSATYGATNGVGDYFNLFTVGPTGGTIIDTGVDLPAINLNIGNSKPLGATIKLGGQGDTVIGGRSTPLTLIPEGTIFRLFPASPIVIAPGTSVAVGFQPPAGNSSMNVTAQTVIYREET